MVNSYVLYCTKNGTISPNDMAISKKYFHDHLVLLLLSIQAFLAIAGSIFILLRLTSSHSAGYVIGYRAALGTRHFQNGTVTGLLAFIGFAFIVLVAHTVLSMRSYHIHRQLAISILGSGILLLVLNIIISNALLVLR